MTINEARKAYATILTALKLERDKRDRFLGEPRRSVAMHEMTVAIEALVTLGAVINRAIDAGLLTGDSAAIAPEQAPLLDVPEGRYP